MAINGLSEEKFRAWSYTFPLLVVHTLPLTSGAAQWVECFGYGLDYQAIVICFSEEARYVSLTRSVQTDYGAHPASCSDGIKGSLPGRKRPGCEYYHSYPSSKEIKKARSWIVTEQHSLMSWYLNKNRDLGWPWMANHVGQIYWPSDLWHNCSSGMY